MGTTTAMAIVPPLVRPPLFVLLGPELTSPDVPEAVADDEVDDEAVVPTCALCVEVINSVTTCPFDAPSVGVTVTTDVITISDDVGVSLDITGVAEVCGVVWGVVAGVVGEVVVGVFAAVVGGACVVVEEVVGGNTVGEEEVVGGRGSVVVIVELEDMVNRLSRITLGFLRPKIPC